MIVIERERKEGKSLVEQSGEGMASFSFIFVVCHLLADIFHSISSCLIAFGVDGWRAEERDLFSPHIQNTD